LQVVDSSFAKSSFWHYSDTLLGNQGGGELSIKGRDGRIRSKDTIAPGNDPFPPRDTEH